MLKYLKEYSDYLAYESDQFTPEDVEELLDVYQDIVDELGLYDNPFMILKVDDSSFQLPKKYKGKMCKIFIRTIATGFGDEVSSEEVEYHKQKLKELEPHLERIKRMGYIVEVLNLLTGPKQNLVVNGSEIQITKKPHQYW